MKIINVYEKNGPVHEVMVDDEDYDFLMTFEWIWREGYAVRKVGRTFYQMHRQIRGVYFKEPILVDHEDGNHCNNQKYNLRRANRFQNQQNRKTNEGNKLPKGIRLLPNGKYNVRVQAYNSRRVFGAFDTLEEAVEARNAKARELHGEFARDAHMIETIDEPDTENV